MIKRPLDLNSIGLFVLFDNNLLRSHHRESNKVCFKVASFALHFTWLARKAFCILEMVTELGLLLLQFLSLYHFLVFVFWNVLTQNAK